MGWSNLPPGVTDDMIPGNRPEDARYEQVWNAVEKLLRRLDVEEADDDDYVDKIADRAYELVEEGTPLNEAVEMAVYDSV